jgi:hypothetical protein
MVDVIINPGKLCRFAFHAIRVLRYSIAYKSASYNYIRAFYFLVLWYKECAGCSTEVDWFARSFPAVMSDFRERPDELN